MTRTLAYPVTPTITGAYSAGDVVGGLLDLTPLCGGGGGGTIRQIRVVDDSDVGSALFVYLFDGKPTVTADNGVFATLFAIGDHKKLIARVSVAAADYIQINSNKMAIKDDINISHGTGQLWAYIVTNGSTPTYTAGDLTLTVVGLKDDA